MKPSELILTIGVIAAIGVGAYFLIKEIKTQSPSGSINWNTGSTSGSVNLAGVGSILSGAGTLATDIEGWFNSGDSSDASQIA